MDAEWIQSGFRVSVVWVQSGCRVGAEWVQRGCRVGDTLLLQCGGIHGHYVPLVNIHENPDPSVAFNSSLP